MTVLSYTHRQRERERERGKEREVKRERESRVGMELFSKKEFLNHGPFRDSFSFIFAITMRFKKCAIHGLF